MQFLIICCLIVKLISTLDRFPYSAWKINELIPQSLTYVGKIRFNLEGYRHYKHVATAEEKATYDTRYHMEDAFTHIIRKKKKRNRRQDHDAKSEPIMMKFVKFNDDS